MKRAYIRGLWGEYGDERTFGRRRLKMDLDIELLLKNPYRKTFMTFVCGKNNYELLKEKGFKTRLIDPRPYVYPKGECHQYGHKLLIIQKALEIYDEIIFLDFDTMACTETPKTLWDTCYKKDDIQCHLRGYKNVKCFWRAKGENRRVRACAAWVYCRSKPLADKLLYRWEHHKNLSEEQIISMVTDKMMGGWHGYDQWMERFETPFFSLDIREAYRVIPKEITSKKNICFLHYQKIARHRMHRMIRRRGVKQAFDRDFKGRRF